MHGSNGKPARVRLTLSLAEQYQVLSQGHTLSKLIMVPDMGFIGCFNFLHYFEEFYILPHWQLYGFKFTVCLLITFFFFFDKQKYVLEGYFLIYIFYQVFPSYTFPIGGLFLNCVYWYLKNTFICLIICLFYLLHQKHTTIYIWEREDNLQESILSSHYMGPKH